MSGKMANREDGRVVGVDLNQIKSESKIEFQCPIHIGSQANLHSEDRGSAEPMSRCLSERELRASEPEYSQLLSRTIF